MKKIIVLLSVLTLLNCSSNDDDNNSNTNSEFIVGEWIVIERYESNTETETMVCDDHRIYEFNNDYSHIQYLINQDDVPHGTVPCFVIFGSPEWNEIEENKYEIRSANNYLFYTASKKDRYLELEFPDTDNSVILNKI